MWPTCVHMYYYFISSGDLIYGQYVFTGTCIITLFFQENVLYGQYVFTCIVTSFFKDTGFDFTVRNLLKRIPSYCYILSSKAFLIN